MKKILIAILAVIMVSCSVAFAQEPMISISEVSVAEGLVTVKITNALASETDITMTAVKEIADDGVNSYTEDDKTYAFYQTVAEASSTIELKFYIPNSKDIPNKDAIRGSGTYMISVQNGNGERTAYELIYADSAAIEQFIRDLNTAADSMTEQDTPYSKLWPIFEGVDEAIITSLGIDYDSFMAYDESIHTDMMNILCEGEITGANVKNALGVSIYNNVNKEDGMTIIAPQYDEKAVSASLYGEAAALMKNIYASYGAFEADFKASYGFYTINNADVDSVKTTLATFKEETGLCETAINKIIGLGSTKSYKACKYIADQTSLNKVKTETDLNTLLDGAYNASQEGGNEMGSSDNRVYPDSTFVSATQGTFTSDEKVEKPALIFPDLSADHWAAESVKKLKEDGIISGTDKGMFEPDRAVTREEFAKMLVLICGYETEGANADFKDAKSGEWYFEYIGTAADKGIVNGIGDNMFGVGQIISRQDMAVMTYNALTAMNITSAKERDYEEFNDFNEISDYAQKAVAALYEAGIISGKGNGMFEPSGSATRAEAAKIIYYAFK